MDSKPTKEPLSWGPYGLPVPSGANFALRSLTTFKGTRVVVVEGCGKDGHGTVREITYWFDDMGFLLARYDPTDEIDTARGPGDSGV